MRSRLLLSLFLLSTTCALAQNLVQLSLEGRYHSGVFDEGALEIAAYDSASQRVFAVNGHAKTVDVFDLADPANPLKVDSLDLSNFGDQANSVDFKAGVLAIAVEADEVDQKGRVVFTDAQLNLLADVEVGVLPDMVTFTPDGTKVLTANEGEPDDDYTVDPQGTISIIDISGGLSGLNAGKVTTLDFTAFDHNYPAGVRNFGPLPRFFEDFSDTATALGNLIVAKPIGSVSWYYDDFGGDYFAEANAFNSDTVTEGWLITPRQNLTGIDSAYFSFYSAKNFSGGNLEVLISRDYDVAVHSNPAKATWDTITAQFALSPGSYTDLFSGRYSLHNYLGDSVSIAFYYTGAPGGGNASLWQIDDIRLEGTQPRLSQNLEPEYVAVNAASTQAFVACQENNALAMIDLNGPRVSSLLPLGTKDWSTGKNKLDASNRSASVNLRNWPIQSFYMPDAIKAFEAGGRDYIVTANEGDAREYDAYDEESRVEDEVLDPTAFPNRAHLQMEDSLGRLKISTAQGDTDGDGDFDALYGYGGRSFSVWDAAGNLVWDSGAEFAQEVFNAYPNNFNANNDDNSSFKSRSDDKGCEPEAVEIAMINGYRLAFIGLERMGGIMVYDLTNPNQPSFVSYFLPRDFSVAASDRAAGDLGPEDLRFVSASQSPNGEPLLIAANEVSGTLAIYRIGGTIGLSEAEKNEALTAYPNPTTGPVKLSRKVEDAVLYNLQGQALLEVNGQNLDLSQLPAGLYLLKTQKTELQLLKR